MDGPPRGIVLDCRHASKLARFWEVALGWRIRPYDEAEVARLAALGLTPETDPTVAIDSPDGSLVFFLQEVPEGKFGEPRTGLVSPVGASPAGQRFA
jgi:hypothetical protein